MQITDQYLINIDKGLFLHLKKALDTANHEILLAKLQLYGIHGVNCSQAAQIILK